MTTEQAEQALETNIAMLRRLIAESPPTSYTAEMARRTIAEVQSPDCALSLEHKVLAVRTKVSEYKNARLLDSSHHHPGDRKNGVIA